MITAPSINNSRILANKNAKYMLDQQDVFNANDVDDDFFDQTMSKKRRSLTDDAKKKIIGESKIAAAVGAS